MTKKKTTNLPQVHPARVRYIKLGHGGGWERECVAKGIIRIGFASGAPERFNQCRSGRWKAVAASFKRAGKTGGTATRFANELRLFFEDDGSTLWITFAGDRLYWGCSTDAPPKPSPDGNGVWRSIRGGWRCTDVNGEALTKDNLSGALTKLAAYRGTSCDVDVNDYVVRRVNGHKTPEVERAIGARQELVAAALDLMKLLGPKDFELLVDLVFTSSGWRRLGVVGKTQKTLDLSLELPSTGERAFVQVKSRTDSRELADYIEQIDDGLYRRMFFVFHSGEVETDDERVTVIGPEKLAELVADAGLVGWLIRKVS
jgi:hypothetical protein